MNQHNLVTSETPDSSRRPGQDKCQNHHKSGFATLGNVPSSTGPSASIQAQRHPSLSQFGQNASRFSPHQFFTSPQGASELSFMRPPLFPNFVSDPMLGSCRGLSPCQNQIPGSNNNGNGALFQATARPSFQGQHIYSSFSSAPPPSFQNPRGLNLPVPGQLQGFGINQCPGQAMRGSNQFLSQQRLHGPVLNAPHWTYRPNRGSPTTSRYTPQSTIMSSGGHRQMVPTFRLTHQNSSTSAQSPVQSGRGYVQLTHPASIAFSQYQNAANDAPGTQRVCQSMPSSTAASSSGSVATSSRHAPSSFSTTSMTSSSMTSSYVTSQSHADATLGSVTPSGQTSVPSSLIQHCHSSKGQGLTNLQNAPASKHVQKKASAMAFWLEYVKKWYPYCHTKTYFLPPQHFNRVQYGVEIVADETVLVPEVPSTQAGRRQGPNYPTASSQGRSSQTVAGTVWTQPQGPPAPLPCYQQNDLTDDAATEHVLTCLRELSNKEKQVMMVISRLEFRKYLDSKADPIHAVNCRLFPRPDKIVGKKCDGECDLLIVHRQFGLIVGEIKSVGANLDHIPNLDDAVVRRVRRAIGQLRSAAKVLSHLVSDISKTITVTKILILPHITTTQLTQALTKDSLLQQDFCNCLDSPDLTLAVSRCMCKDYMPTMADLFTWNKPPAKESRPKEPKMFKPFNMYKLSESSDEEETDETSSESQDDDFSGNSDDDSEMTSHAGKQSQTGTKFSKLSSWWKQITSNNPNIKTTMTDCLYDQLLARFCGPATTVDVPTVTAPRVALTTGFGPQCKVLRTRGQAVAETGLIMSTLALYPQQVDILNDANLHNVYLCGPPGVGKTLMITLKASQWLRQGHDVDMIVMDETTRAVAMLIEAQLQHVLSSDPGRYSSRVRCHAYYDLREYGCDSATVDEISAFAQDDQLFIVMDEMPGMALELLEKLKAKVPLVSVWCAGTHKFREMPKWMDEKVLTVPLRSPPVISREVDMSGEIQVYLNVLPYSYLPFTHATDGPPIRRLRHTGEPGHVRVDSPIECEACGHAIVQQLNDLDVGNSDPDSLQYRDVLILCSSPHDEERNEGGEVTQEAVFMVKVLRASGIPIKVVTDHSSHDDIKELALAVTDTVMMTDIELVRGLERRVVVGTKDLRYGRISAMSRSIAHVLWIDEFGSN